MYYYMHCLHWYIEHSLFDPLSRSFTVKQDLIFCNLRNASIVNSAFHLLSKWRDDQLNVASFTQSKSSTCYARLFCPIFVSYANKGWLGRKTRQIYMENYENVHRTTNIHLCKCKCTVSYSLIHFPYSFKTLSILERISTKSASNEKACSTGLKYGLCPFTIIITIFHICKWTTMEYDAIYRFTLTLLLH